MGQILSVYVRIKKWVGRLAFQDVGAIGEAATAGRTYAPWPSSYLPFSPFQGELRGRASRSARTHSVMKTFLALMVCVSHCRITRECLGGGVTSWLGGFGKEVSDEINKWKSFGRRDGYDSWDMKANEIGRKCGDNKRRSCADQCLDAFNAGNLYPPPPPASSDGSTF
jgi:hypothetical protein